MVCLRRRCAPWLLAAVLAGAMGPVAADDSSFPFGSELMLDAMPMPGSKRVPILQIEDNGTASINLWCASLRAQATVGQGTITIVPGAAPAADCGPERQSRD